MATEYQLSYTASEINQKLGAVDNKLDASELNSAIDSALAEAKASGEFDGKDGVSITGIELDGTENTNDGAINTYEVWGGASYLGSFSVKNGSKGSDGKTPVKGTDYWTAADKAEMVEDVIEELNKEELPYTNVLKSALDEGGVSVYNTKGWRENTRLNSSNIAVDDEGGLYLTGYIHCNAGDIIRLKNITMQNTDDWKTCVVMFFSDCNSTASVGTSHGTYLTNYQNAIWGSDGNLEQFKVTGDSVAYIRIQCAGISYKSIITVNEEIPEDSIDIRLSTAEESITNLKDRVEILENSTPTVSDSDDVPDYVVTEAESVVDKVIAAQGTRTFTFAAISDLHYGNGSYTDGIKHACQAMKYIDERIKLDAVAILGDYTDGKPTTTYNDSIADFKAVNALLSNIRFTSNLRIRGNHDLDVIDSPLNYRYIYAFSDDVVWGDRIGGYFYKDFEDYKLRVICLNTVEGGSNAICSTEQYNWFVNSLDLTSKEDAEDWGILALSHHPMDWWTDPYAFAYILDAYKDGKSWTNGTIACNFEGKNKATFIGNIHGHIHNFKTDYLRLGNPTSTLSEQTSVLRMGTPNACYDRENQYTDASYNGVWVEDNTYSKTKNSANDTAFVIYCIDLDTGIINAISYGAGYDRTINYLSAGNIETTFTITNNLTNVSNNNANASIVSGQSYAATLTTTNGNDFESVVVTMGGVDVTASVYANGVITIPVVTGSIVITANAKEVEVIVNLIDTAGVTSGKRLSATNGTERDSSDMFITGYIPITSAGDVFRTSGASFNAYVNGSVGIWIYEEDKTYWTYDYTNPSQSPISKDYWDIVIDNNGNLTVTIKRENEVGQYIRLCGIGTGEGLLVTKNQPIE
jgi:hypothetical protein